MSNRSIRVFRPQDLHHPQWPKEKLRPDSSSNNNNNENSVPRDFDSIDGNSNLGARSQRQRIPASSTKRKLDKAKEQSMLGKLANQILKFSPIVSKEPGRNHSWPSGPGASTSAPSISPSPLQRTNQNRPLVLEKKAVSVLPPSVAAKKEQPQCEVSGKEAISALSRARSRECRQQIVEIYCKHKQGALMPEKVPRYCPLEGEFSFSVFLLSLSLGSCNKKQLLKLINTYISILDFAINFLILPPRSACRALKQTAVQF